MSWESIKNCGKIKQELKNIQINEGKIKAGEFLNETMAEFARVSTRIFDTTGEFAFTYKEKQLSSIFLPTFFNLGYGAIQEVPTRRKERGQESTHGWLDYWVQKDEKWVYLIEVKHGWQFLHGTITKDSQKKISESIKQLKNIRKSEVNELSTVETTYKISLIILPVWRNINKEENIQEDEEYPTGLKELEETVKNIIDEISNKISWIGIWSIPERMQHAFESSQTEKLQTFAGVIFIATLVP
jgi:hypothetical protein